ncbi:unnamed protein product [Schistosoma turkestanicum]|nr:unnamed protein product [Schistosoma turkestanicum]
MLLLYAVITSLMVIILFRCPDITYQIAAWSVALTWFFIFTTIGDSLPKLLPTNKKWLLTILTISCTLNVVGILIAALFKKKPAPITLEQVAEPALISLIILDLVAIALLTLLNMTVGQATLGKFRLTDDDACLASLLLYITLMLQQITGYSNFLQFTNNTFNNCSTENNAKSTNQTFYQDQFGILLEL